MTRFVAVACTVFFAAACRAPSTEIADVSVVTTLPKEVGPGGYEQRVGADGIATGHFFKAQISDCGSAVAETGRRWAAQHALTEGTSTVGTGQARLRFSSSQFPDGAFVIVYTLGSSRESARVRFAYEASSGATASPVGEFASLGVEALVDSLVEAARCD